MNTNTPRFHRSFALALCASVLGLAACGDGTTPATPAPGDEVRSTHARITAPAVPAADRASLVAGNTRFAADVYRALAAEPGNVIYSPHSISIALGMTWAGARNNTERQMAQTLRFGMSQAQTHAAFNALDQELAHRAERAPEGGGRPFRLRVVNKLWGQRGYTFQPTFLDTLAENYGAGLNVLNFMGDPEGSRGRINAWVSEQTEGKIPMLLGQGSIVPSTTLVLPPLSVTVIPGVSLSVIVTVCVPDAVPVPVTAPKPSVKVSLDSVMVSSTMAIAMGCVAALWDAAAKVTLVLDRV